jgi:hypothetical protein
MSDLILSNKTHAWEQKLRQQQSSGLSMTSWCRVNEIPYNTFAYWKRRLGQKGQLQRESFIELETKSASSGIGLECNGIRIHLETDFDPMVLAKCLRVLKEVQC